MTTMTMSFRIDGSFLTERAKDYVLEHDLFGAIEFLNLSLEGISYEQSLSVVTGEYKFVGNTADEGIFLAPRTDEEREAYVNEIKDIYRNCYIIDKKVYKIYQKIPYLQYDDFVFAKESVLDVSRSIEFTKQRIMYYAKNPLDKALVIKKEFYLLEAVETKVPKGCEFLFNSINSDERDIVEPFMPTNEDIKPMPTIENEKRIELPKRKGGNQFEYYTGLINEQLEELGEAENLVNIVEDDKDSEIKIPKVMLEAYINTFKFASKKIETVYKPVTWSGIRLSMDAPAHSDILIYLGFDIFGDYDYDNDNVRNLNLALMDTANRFILESKVYENVKDSFNVKILSSNKDFDTVFDGYCFKHDNLDEMPTILKNITTIVMIEEAGVKYQQIAEHVWKNKGIILTKFGGPLCHLAIIAKEYNGTIIQLINENEFDEIADKRVKVDLHDKFAIKQTFKL